MTKTRVCSPKRASEMLSSWRNFAGGSLTVLCVVCPTAVARSQALASPFATISQKIDSTTITVEYYRPSVRGRTIFGKLVPWGTTWTPGANWATTLEVDRDVRIEGHPVPRGKYSVWMIPAAKPDPWTVVLNRSARRFHVQRPKENDDELRFRLTADSSPHVEVLTFSFPVVTRTSATLAFQWAETQVSIRLEIQSSRPPIVASHPLSSYVGVYELGDPNDPPTTPGTRYEIIERDGRLWVRTTRDAVEPGLDPEFDLLPAGGDDFHPRQYKNGVLIGDELDEVITFSFEGGRAMGFEVHGVAEDKILARGRRVVK
jgi:DUF2911 family protein